jgi:hypothetical protein
MVMIRSGNSLNSCGHKGLIYTNALVVKLEYILHQYFYTGRFISLVPVGHAGRPALVSLRPLLQQSIHGKSQTNTTYGTD